MRPLDKGAIPLDDAGNVIAPTDYKKWRKALIDRIGYYCAYCNMPLSHSLQVEHVQPKNPPAGFTAGDPLAWNNMLLACGPCNNAKTNTPIDANTYYLPEEHNTFLPFKEQNVAGKNHNIIVVADNLTPIQEIKSQRTIDLLDLDEIDERDDVVDLRSEKRHDAWLAVLAAKAIFDENKLVATYNAIRTATHIANLSTCDRFFFYLV
jgi:hypothetical protein